MKLEQVNNRVYDKTVEIHPSVNLIAQYMQESLNPNELRGVAIALAAIAPVIWSQFAEIKIEPLHLEFKE